MCCNFTTKTIPKTLANAFQKSQVQWIYFFLFQKSYYKHLPSLFMPIWRHFFSLQAWHWFLWALSTKHMPVPAWHLIFFKITTGTIFQQFQATQIFKKPFPMTVNLVYIFHFYKSSLVSWGFRYKKKVVDMTLFEKNKVNIALTYK